MLQNLLIGLAALLLLVHVGLAVFGQRLVHTTEERHPPIGQFIDGVDGHRLHYRERGARSAPAIVLLHGASANLLDMEASLRPGLDSDYRVITVDRAGSGWSDARAAAAGDPVEQAADVTRVLDALGIEEAIWVGHSWGGAVVMAALVEHAERTLAGVAISAPTHPWKTPLPLTIRLGAMPLVGHALAASWVQPLGGQVLDSVLRDSFVPEDPPEPIADYRTSTGAALALRPTSFRATSKDLVGLNSALAHIAPRYGEIERPLLLINGTEDPLIPSSGNAERVLAALPSAELVQLPGAGHIVHHTRQARVLSEIKRWIQRVDNRR